MALICDEDAALRVLMMIAGVERHEQDDGWGTSIYRIGELADLAWGSHSRVVEQLEGAKVGLDACSKELRSRDHELMRIQDELKAMEAGMRSLEEALEEARRELNWERGAHAACMTQLDILVAKAAEGERRVLDGRAERELEVNLRLVRELEEDNARLREELRDSVEARAAHVRRLSEDERRGEELMGEVSRLETACDLLRAEMGEVETALKEEVDLRDERIRDISASLAGRDGRIASLEDERDAALSAAAAVRGELGVISSQKQSLEAENAACELTSLYLHSGTLTPARLPPSPGESLLPLAAWRVACVTCIACCCRHLALSYFSQSGLSPFHTSPPTHAPSLLSVRGSPLLSPTLRPSSSLSNLPSPPSATRRLHPGRGSLLHLQGHATALPPP